MGCRRVLIDNEHKMTKIDVLLGLQWGDEGKGKIVDVLTPRYDVMPVSRAAPMQVTRLSSTA